jgi:hypothetical protein
MAGQLQMEIRRMALSGRVGFDHRDVTDSYRGCQTLVLLARCVISQAVREDARDGVFGALAGQLVKQAG